MSKFIDKKPEGINQTTICPDDNPLDIFFKIHERVNAKSEETNKSYKNNILVSFDDIKQLHLKTIQSIASLNPAKSNVGIRIAISHNEGEADKFNSFEEFEKHNITSPNPTSSINMVYVFTLYDGDTSNFENYKITSQIRSRIAELKQLESEAPPFIPRAFLANMVTTTAKISIEYSDYVKTRHFIAMFDEWIRACDESNSSKTLESMKSFSYLFPRIGKLIIYALLAIFTINAIDSNLIQTSLSVKFIIAYASFFVIISNIAEMCLRKIEMSIDGYLPVSYLNINKGDAKLIKEWENRNKTSFIMAVVGAMGMICTGVITRFTYDLIKWFIS